MPAITMQPTVDQAIETYDTTVASVPRGLWPLWVERVERALVTGDDKHLDLDQTESFEVAVYNVKRTRRTISLSDSID